MYDNQDDKPKGAKKALDVKSGTERRMRDNISVRKRAHMDRIKQVRGEGNDPAPETVFAPSAEPNPQGSMNPMDYDQSSPPATIPLALLPQFVAMVMSNDMNQIFHGTLMVRKLLSVEASPPINEVVQTGVVPALVELLKRSDNPQLQFEAAWALTNIASGNHENSLVVIQANAVPQFLELLRSTYTDCREQSTWALGNLAGEGGACRDYLLQMNVMDPLLMLLSTEGEALAVMRNATWTLSNLCRSKPQPPLEQVGVALPVLASLLNYPDDEVCGDAAWAISYISDGPNERIQAVLESGVLTRIVELLRAPSTAIQTPAIRTIGNIATGNELQTQTIINAGSLPSLIQLLYSPKRAIRKETCWTVSNIAAGTRHQIEALIEGNVYPSIIKCLQGTELDVKKEAAWAVANLCSSGISAHIQYLVEIGIIPPLCEVLSVYDPKIVCVALEALENILRIGESLKAETSAEANYYAQEVESCGGVDRMEELQTHTNEEVYNLALNILETYFGAEDIGGGTGAGAGDFGNFGGFGNFGAGGGGGDAPEQFSF